MSSTSVPAARPRAIWVARPRWRRPGLRAKPTKVMTGSTIHPVSRSSTTEAKLVGGSARVAGQAGDPQHVAADGGGQDVGHELAGQVVRQQPPQAGALAEGVRTACQRRADSTMPARVSSAAPSSQSAVSRFHSGRSGRLDDLSSLARRNHSMRPLTARRTASTIHFLAGCGRATG